MIINNINPTIFHLGPLSIRYYGLVYALGFIGTYFYLQYKIKKRKIDLNLDELDSLMIYLIIGVIIGGRLGEFLFFRPLELITKPLEILFIWHGGMSFHGGLIGVAIAMYLFTKQYKKNFFEILDKLVIPLSIVLVFGRIANFINGELVGTISKLPWATNFHNEVNGLGERVFRHPSQIYEAIKNLVVFFILIIIDQKNKLKKKTKQKELIGTITWWFVLLYGFGRFITDFFRADNHWFMGIISTGQLLSLIMGLLASYILIKKYYFLKKK